MDAHIEEIDANRHGNPSIASGSFGEVSIALYRRQSPTVRRRRSNDHPQEQGAPSSSANNQEQNDGGCWGYAAVKTIRNSVVGCGGRMSLASSWGFAGGDMNTSSGSNFADQNSASSSKAPQLTREVFAELAALRALSGRHPCIIPLLAAYPSRSGLGRGTGLSLAFPYCPIDLASAIKQKRYNVGPGGGMISDFVVKAIFRNVMSGLKHCHEHGVVHGDVNPANFMVSAMGRIQLADWGLATACPSLVRSNEAKGESNGDEKLPTHALCALNYRAPEIILGETSPNPSIDIWGAGLILCELLTLRTTFLGRNDIDQLNRIFDILGTPSTRLWPDATSLPDFGKIRFDPREPQGMTHIVPMSAICDDLRDVIDATVSLDPAKRVAAAKCIDMRWFTSTPLPADPCRVLEAMVPGEHIISPVVFPNLKDGADDLEGAKQRAVSIAATIRAHSRLNAVKGHRYDEHGKSTGEGAFQCRVKANGLLKSLRSQHDNNVEMIDT